MHVGASMAALQLVYCAAGGASCTSTATPLRLAEGWGLCWQVFHAGTASDEQGQVVAAGGRVLSVTALGDSVAAAQRQAYQVSPGHGQDTWVRVHGLG